MPDKMTQIKQKNIIYFAIFLLSIFLFITYIFALYIGAGYDDTMITMWVGENIAGGKGILNYNYNTEEISSSILHALVIAIISLLSDTNMYMINKFFGIFSATLVMIILFVNRHRLFGKVYGDALATLTVLLIATSTPYQYWAAGGMETPLQGLLLVCYIIAVAVLLTTTRRSWLFAAIIFQCLYILVRPEGFYLLPVSLLACLLGRWYSSDEPPWSLLLAPLLFFVSVCLARAVFLGAAFPNPVYAKTGTFLQSIPVGLSYIKDFYQGGAQGWFQLAAVASGIAVSCVLLVRGFLQKIMFTPDQRIVVLLTAVAVGVDMYVIAVGGTWMGYFRFMVPTVAIKAVLLAKVLHLILPSVSERWINWLLPVGIIAVLALVLAVPMPAASQCGRKPYKLAELFSDLSGLNRRLMLVNCAQGRDIEGIEPFIRREMGRYLQEAGNLTIVTYQMGFFPYTVRQEFPDPKKVSFVDTMGLTDRKIAMLDMPNSPYGIDAGRHPDKVLAGEAGVLSDYVLKQAPNMVYILGASTDERKVYQKLGFNLIWDKPGAVVFFKP